MEDEENDNLKDTDSDQEYRVERSYDMFLRMMSPVFSNSYSNALSHLIFPFFFGVVVLVLFRLCALRHPQIWATIKPTVTPFLCLVAFCQSIRYGFFIFNYNIGGERIPTSRALCSIAAYFYALTSYIPYFAASVTLAHRLVTIHVPSTTIRHLHQALGLAVTAYMLTYFVHFVDKHLELAWVCRPYYANEQLRKIMHAILTCSKVSNVLMGGYLMWAERKQLATDHATRAGIALFFALHSLAQLTRMLIKFTLMYVFGGWMLLRWIVYIEEMFTSMHLVITIFLLLLSIDEFRALLIVWFRFNRRQPRTLVPIKL